MDITEITNQIYDKLFDNHLDLQLDLNTIESQEVIADSGIIYLELTDGSFVKIKVSEPNYNPWR